MGGRKKRHQNPLPLETSTRVALGLRALKRTRNISPAAIVRNLAVFGSSQKDLAQLDPELAKEDFLPAIGTIRTIIDSGAIMSDGIAKALHHFMRVMYPDVMSGVTNTSGETWVAETRAMLNHTREANAAKVEAFAGTYALYRPFHLQPRDYVIVERLTIGKPGPFDCTLSADYVFEGAPEAIESSGKIVPHGPKLLVFLRVGESRFGDIIIVFDKTKDSTRRGTEGKVTLKGAMLASVGTDDPISAWPCFANRARAAETVKTRVIPKSEFAESPNIPQDARDVLAKGAIYWRESDYPFPLEV